MNFIETVRQEFIQLADNITPDFQFKDDAAVRSRFKMVKRFESCEETMEWFTSVFANTNYGRQLEEAYGKGKIFWAIDLEYLYDGFEAKPNMNNELVPEVSTAYWVIHQMINNHDDITVPQSVVNARFTVQVEYKGLFFIFHSYDLLTAIGEIVIHNDLTLWNEDTGVCVIDKLC